MTIAEDTRLAWGTIIRPEDGIGGVNERCIEIPLGLGVAKFDQPGWVLDAGCALLPPMHGVPDGRSPIANVVHLTQAIGSERIKPRSTQLSFMSADLRDLHIFADDAFDRVVCISTLEHVGYDNTSYGAKVEADAHYSWLFALNELWRVTKDELLITVPYHKTKAFNPKWGYFTSGPVDAMIQTVRGEARFYGIVNGKWCGGDHLPFVTDLDGFPEKVSQIACIRAVK